MSAELVATIVVALLGSGIISGTIVAWMTRHKVAAEVVVTLVDAARQVADNLRVDLSSARLRIAELEASLEDERRRRRETEDRGCKYDRGAS